MRWMISCCLFVGWVAMASSPEELLERARFDENAGRCWEALLGYGQVAVAAGDSEPKRAQAMGRLVACFKVVGFNDDGSLREADAFVAGSPDEVTLRYRMVNLIERAAAARMKRESESRGSFLVRGNLGELRDKLENIVVPRIEFEETPVSAVIAHLRQRACDLDPDQVGVNLLVIPGEAGDSARRTVTMKLEEMSLEDILDYLCALLGWSFAVHSHAVYLGPPSVVDDRETGIYPLASSELLAMSGNSAAVCAWLASHGVAMDDGCTAAVTGEKLIVRHRRTALKRVEQLLRELNFVPANISFVIELYAFDAPYGQSLSARSMIPEVLVTIPKEKRKVLLHLSTICEAGQRSEVQQSGKGVLGEAALRQSLSVLPRLAADGYAVATEFEWSMEDHHGMSHRVETQVQSYDGTALWYRVSAGSDDSPALFLRVEQTLINPGGYPIRSAF